MHSSWPVSIGHCLNLHSVSVTICTECLHQFAQCACINLHSWSVSIGHCINLQSVSVSICTVGLCQFAQLVCINSVGLYQFAQLVCIQWTLYQFAQLVCIQWTPYQFAQLGRRQRELVEGEMIVTTSWFDRRRTGSALERQGGDVALPTCPVPSEGAVLQPLTRLS